MAQDIYRINKSKAVQKTFADDYVEELSFGSHSVANGTTGGTFIRKETSIAIFAKGKRDYDGHVFLIFRGTDKLLDWITDFNIGTRTTHAGLAAHAGFVRAFADLEQAITNFMPEIAKAKSVHIIGHSLGGALASLAVERIADGRPRKKSIFLYTFGAPRVGTLEFAKHLEGLLGAENIYRVYHNCDPVPMIPTWPFFHCALSDRGYHLLHPARVHAGAGYVKSMNESNSWPLLHAYSHMKYTERSIQHFLLSDKPVTLTNATIFLFSEALSWVIASVAKGMALTLGGGLATMWSVFDRLAYLLKSEAELDEHQDSWAMRLLKKLCTVLGLRHSKNADFSHSFIRTILTTFYHRTIDIVRSAMRRVDSV